MLKCLYYLVIYLFLSKEFLHADQLTIKYEGDCIKMSIFSCHLEICLEAVSVYKPRSLLLTSDMPENPLKRVVEFPILLPLREGSLNRTKVKLFT